MRTMLRWTVPVEKGNEAIRDGSIGRTIESLLQQLEPEAAYFLAEHGERAQQRHERERRREEPECEACSLSGVHGVSFLPGAGYPAMISASLLTIFAAATSGSRSCVRTLCTFSWMMSDMRG